MAQAQQARFPRPASDRSCVNRRALVRLPSFFGDCLMTVRGLAPRARALAAKRPRGSVSAGSALLLVGLLAVLFLSPALADPPPIPNQAPQVIMSSTNLGSGVWKITGFVQDDQSPVGLMVEIWGPPLAEPGGSEV